MKFYFKESLGLLFKTWPFVMLKLLVYFLISLVFLVIAGVFAFIYVKVGGGIITFFILLFALLAFWGFVKLLRRYVLYLLKAGHIAVLGELVQKGEIPGGQGMVAYGFSKVKSKFVTSSAFFVVDEVVRGVVHGITNLIEKIGNWIPIQAVQQIFRLIAQVASVFLNYIDEAILSFIFTHEDKDVWKGVRDGLVLYFKCWKQLLATSVFIVLLSYAISVGLFVLSYILTAPLAAMLPFFFKDIPFIIALWITGLIYVAFISQFTLVWMIVTYQESIKGVSADSETIDQLEALVPKFKEVTMKAGRVISSGFNNLAKSSSSPDAADVPLSPEMQTQVDKLTPTVKQLKGKGYKDTQIRTALIDKGWKPDVVDEALKK